MIDPIPARKNASRLPAGIALATIVALMMLWPGDAPWINDEPQLFGLALRANHTPAQLLGIHFPFSIAMHGLQGTRGAVYGPVPVWIYQIFLLLSRDPRVFVCLHVAMLAGTTAFALYWLTNSLGVTPWLAVVCMLSPWMWIYGRQLWDNSFCIPLSVLTLAVYGGFLTTGRAWSLRIALIVAALMPMIHLMSLALIVPIGLHLLLSQRKAIVQYRYSFILIAGVALLISLPYLNWLRQKYESGFDPDRSPIIGFFYPLIGGHHFTAAGLGNILGDDWPQSIAGPAGTLVMIGAIVSHLAYLAVLAGIMLSIPRVRRVLSKQNPTPIDHLALIALGALICQCLLDGLQRVYDGPHYFNATYGAYAIFAFLAVRSLYESKKKSRLKKFLLPIQAAAMAIVTIAMAVQIHINGGMPWINYGPSIGEQTTALQAVGSRNMLIDPGFLTWDNLPVEYQVLRQIIDVPDSKKTGSALVRFRGEFPGDVHIIVQDIPN